MTTVLQHGQGTVTVKGNPAGGSRVRVSVDDPSVYVPRGECATTYNLGLIQQILDVTGPAWLCDEIARDQDPGYVQRTLLPALTGFVAPERFAGARMLDFGSGSGASTMILARAFPGCEIVGVELEPRLLALAEARRHFYGFGPRVRFVTSPAGDVLPPGIGRFDFVVLSAVFEHLLPDERRTLLPLLWSSLEPGGVLFVAWMPSRWYPVEGHTTGLPLLAYLPDSVALRLAHRYSMRVRESESWPQLLRKGIRGGSLAQLRRIIRADCAEEPVVLHPLHAAGDIAFWFTVTDTSKQRSALKRAMRRVIAVGGRMPAPVQRSASVLLLPDLTVALQRPS
jgi:SAM-dependent methyltransferase